MSVSPPTATRLPYFAFYPSDWLSSFTVTTMTLAAEATYVRLLCYSWNADGLPRNTEVLRRLTKVSAAEWDEVWAQVEPMFPVAADGKRRNERQERERETAGAKRDRRVSAGRRGGAARWQSQLPSDGIATSNANDNGNSNAMPAAMPMPVAPEWQAEAEAEAEAEEATATAARMRAVLVAAANQSFRQRWGDAVRPFPEQHPGATLLAGVAVAVGLSPDAACALLVEAVRRSNSKRPLRSLAYFCDMFREHAEDSVAASNGGVDAVQHMAVHNARAGHVEWQEFCAARGIVWREETSR